MVSENYALSSIKVCPSLVDLNPPISVFGKQDTVQVVCPTGTEDRRKDTRGGDEGDVWKGPTKQISLRRMVVDIQVLRVSL